jgi:hypothetical protein
MRSERKDSAFYLQTGETRQCPRIFSEQKEKRP